MVTQTPSASLYIHVPFCRQRCAYCHFDIKVFHPRTSQAPFIDTYLTALYKELEHLAARHPRRLHSVFLGGGTPSRLSPDQLAQILATTARLFDLTPNAEISLEVNPEDVGPNTLESLRAAGFTRISFGVQSFQDDTLKAINRAHDGAGARRALAAMPDFAHGLSLDLMLGLPHQTQATLQQDLDIVLASPATHLSVYLLERDLPTPLDKKAASLPDDDTQADFYEYVTARLQQAGFEHYEVSNFAKPGYRCRHNLTYWQSGDYLAAGPAAHGRIGSHYSANIAQFTPWLHQVQATGSGVHHSEHWSDERFRQERIIQGLRLLEGIPRAWCHEEELDQLKPFIKAGWLATDQERIRLLPKGLLTANEIFGLFVNEATQEPPNTL